MMPAASTASLCTQIRKPPTCATNATCPCGIPDSHTRLTRQQSKKRASTAKVCPHCKEDVSRRKKRAAPEPIYLTLVLVYRSTGAGANDCQGISQHSALKHISIIMIDPAVASCMHALIDYMTYYLPIQKQNTKGIGTNHRLPWMITENDPRVRTFFGTALPMQAPFTSSSSITSFTVQRQGRGLPRGHSCIALREWADGTACSRCRPGTFDVTNQLDLMYHCRPLV